MHAPCGIVNAYSVELFLHVVGVVIVFAGYGALLFATATMRLAKRTEEVRATARIFAGRKVGFEYISVIDLVVIAGGVLLIVAGVEMASSVWGFSRGWVAVSIATIAAIGLVGAFVLSPRLRRISVLASQTPDGPLPESLRALTHDPLLATTLYAATGGLLGVLFLMTNKPSLSISVGVIALAVALGASIELPYWRSARLR